MGFLHAKSHRTSTGRALVVKADALTVHNGPAWAGTESTLHAKIAIRVTPDDGGPQFDSRASAWGGDEEHLVHGHWTYVLYDPEQPDECDIDSDRLTQEFGKVDGHKQRTSVPQWVSDEWADKAAGRAPRVPTILSSPSAGSAAAPQGIVAGLDELVALHAAGTLSDAEFSAAKSQLLAHG
jgi:hypothetical protein